MISFSQNVNILLTVTFYSNHILKYARLLGRDTIRCVFVIIVQDPSTVHSSYYIEQIQERVACTRNWETYYILILRNINQQPATFYLKMQWGKNLRLKCSQMAYRIALKLAAHLEFEFDFMRFIVSLYNFFFARQFLHERTYNDKTSCS